MLTIGSTPGPGALHLTQGVVRVVVVGVSVIFSTIYIRIHILIYAYIYIYAYLLLYLYVCPRSTPILYRIAHTFIAYTHFAHILDCARHARHNPYVGHARHQLYSDYARAGNQKTIKCVDPPWDAYLLICSFLGTILRLCFLLKDFPGLDCV